MSRRARRLIAATIITLNLATSATAPASAAFPGVNGRITFMRFDADGWFQIWVANGDMSNQVQITHGVGGSGFPSWSPDGTRIAFDSHRTDPDQFDNVEISDVFTMRPDGTDIRQLTDSKGVSGPPKSKKIRLS